MTPPPNSTPWGEPLSQRTLAPGIIRVTTRGHGGYYLAPAQHCHICELFPGHETFAGGPWYEEDRDWAFVALAFPGAFDGIALRAAFAMLPEPFLAPYVATELGRRTVEQVRQWEREHADEWVPLGEGTHPGGGWRVDFERVRDGARRSARFGAHALHPGTYTEAELASRWITEETRR